MTADIETKKNQAYLKQAIARFGLNLEGLTVFTEAATGGYLYTSLIAALAGAERVYAVTANSRYGAKEEAKEQTLNEARELGVAARLDVIFEKDTTALSRSDIITNSGFVRPVTRETVSAMKPTAVIPLMWETWEFRSDELDLDACREKGILVMGTNERHPSLDLFRSIGFKVAKLLLDLGLSVYNDRYLLIGSGDYGDSIARFFTANSINFDRLSPGRSSLRQDRDEVMHNLAEYDAIIIAEICNNMDILSRDGLIATARLKKENPLVRIVHVCGAVGKDDIIGEGLALYPPEPRPFGHISVGADYLGARPVIELNAAGLKVGEVMARCRLRGMSIEETIKYTLANSPADAYINGK